MHTQRWQVGEYRITSVLEEEVPRIPPQLFFPSATPADVAKHGWLQPDFADAEGRIAMRVQAFVIEGRGRCVLVDPCVGNGKRRAMPFWNERSFPFLERMAEAGLAPQQVDTVVHTHLHVDHVGWDTQFRDGAWVPTFVKARHLYTARELEWRRQSSDPDSAAVYADSIEPILQAGLADIVPEDADLGGGLRLESTPGHTPGHVSLWIESAGEVALVSGDFLHHPVQCVELAWAEIGDEDADLARTTRRRMLERAARSQALFLGTHFPARPAGRIRADGAAYRYEPL